MLKAIGLAIGTGLGTTWPRPRCDAPSRDDHEDSTLTGSDLALATIGTRLSADRPEVAEALRRQVANRLALDQPAEVPQAQRARWHFLRPERLRAEFERDDTVEVDGWLLARSEAAVCVFLSRLA